MNRISDYKELCEKIQEWIKDYVLSNNIKTLIVGVSGGLDSAVVSTLCSKTKVPTIGISIDIDSDHKNSELAKKQLDFIQNMGAKTYELDLTDVYSLFKKKIQGDFHSELGYANSKSRLRMVTLYQAACCFDGIVVGTGNKVEDFGVGFFTKYGDGGVDLSPIADLYKTEVRELGRYLNILPEILNATPTDGLWNDNRNDEEQLGICYEDLEWVMEVGLNYEKEKKITNYEKNLINKFLIHNKKNKHKMKQVPVFDLVKNKII